MATTNKDFITRYGVLIQGNGAVTSSTEQTNALQVNGGIGVAKNIIVGTTATVHGDIIGKRTLTIDGNAQISGQTSLTGSLNVSGVSTFSNTLTLTSGFISNGDSVFNGSIIINGGNTLDLGTGSLALSGDLTVDGTVTFNSSTSAATGGIGALVVPNGGVYVGDNLYIAGTTANDGVNTSNALYIAGGAWIEKSLVVEGAVLFKDGVTFSGTATYVYSTNTIFSDNIINVHTPPGGVGGTWTQDDGKDIGLVFHNYKGSDNDSFLGWANDSGYLEWYGNGLETAEGTFTNGVYGIFKTGGIKLTNTESSISTSTGALQVAGGIGASNVYSVNNISGGTLTARNLTQGRIVFAGVGGELTDDAELTYDAVTNLLSADASRATTATNLAGGGPGMIPYQSDVGITNFVATGTTGFVLISQGTSAPQWEALGSISAGNAFTATNIAGGTANQLVIQTAPGVTGFAGPGNAGQFLRSNGSGSAPTYVNTGNMYVGYAVWADNLKGPANAIPYQSALDTTHYIIPGGNGTLLQSNGTTATFVSTTTLLVGFAENAFTADRWTTPRTVTFGGDLSGFVTIDGSADAIFTATVNSGGFANTATNIAGGTTGAIPYQLAASATTFLSLSGTEHSVISAGTTAPKYVTEVQAKSGTGSATASSGQSLIVTGGIGITGESYFVNNVGFGSNIKILGSSDSNSTDSGSLQVVGGAGIAKNLYVGGDLQVNGVFTASNVTKITNTTESSSTSSGALIVSGGVGIAKNLFVGSSATFSGNLIPSENGLYNLGSPTKRWNTLFVSSSTIDMDGVTIQAINNRLQTEKITISDTANSDSTQTGALVVSGGIGVAKDLVVGASVKIGPTVNSTIVPAVYSNNVILASYTSPTLTTTDPVTIDQYIKNDYRTARYTVQVVDGSSIHITEILVTHNGTNVYLTEYGIITNNGDLGTFTATSDGTNISLTFNPASVTSMTIKVVRFGITA
jgi:enhancing lycopene biosynthesis protein 2